MADDVVTQWGFRHERDMPDGRVYSCDDEADARDVVDNLRSIGISVDLVSRDIVYCTWETQV